MKIDLKHYEYSIIQGALQQKQVELEKELNRLNAYKQKMKELLIR